MGEWSQLLIAWAKIKGQTLTTGNNDYMYFSNSAMVTQFRDELFLPQAGHRNHVAAALGHQGIVGNYWSSTPNGIYAYRLHFYSSYVYADNYESRAYAFSIRCFKNS
jgi:hypothetical protein